MSIQEMIMLQANILLKYIAENKVQAVLDTTLIRAEEISNESIECKSPLAALSQDKTIVAIAFYLTLEEYLGREIASLAVQDIFCVIDDECVKRKLGFTVLNKRQLAHQNNQDMKLDENSSLKFEIIPDKDCYLHLSISKCPIYTLLNKYHLAFLGTYLCYGDQHVYLRNKNYELVRDKMMSKGDMYCDYRIIKK